MKKLIIFLMVIVIILLCSCTKDEEFLTNETTSETEVSEVVFSYFEGNNAIYYNEEYGFYFSVPKSELVLNMNDSFIFEIVDIADEAVTIDYKIKDDKNTQNTLFSIVLCQKNYKPKNIIAENSEYYAELVINTECDLIDQNTIELLKTMVNDSFQFYHEYNEKKIGIVVSEPEIMSIYTQYVSEEYKEIMFDLSNRIYDSINLKKGDVLLVSGELEDRYRVTILSLDVPFLNGFILKDMITFDLKDYNQIANYAELESAKLYNDINGELVNMQSGNCIIEKREGNWALVSLPAGAGEFWVETKKLLIPSVSN
jgi:hypothetical protein